MNSVIYILLVIILATPSLTIFYPQKVQTLTVHPSLSSGKTFQRITHFQGSQPQTGFTLADGGIYGSNRTFIIGSRYGKKTYILSLPQSYQPILVDLDNLNSLTSLTITDKSEPLPSTTYVTRRPTTGWIPSMLLGTFLSDQGSNKGRAYLVKGEKMMPGTFDISNLTPDRGHIFNGGYSTYRNDHCGVSGGIGDLNGDGINDIAIGCRDGSYIAVVYGTKDETYPRNFDLSTITKETGVIITSGCDCGLGGGYLGYSIVFGNFNGDDIDDIAIAASWAYNELPFNVHVIYGQRGGYSDKFIYVYDIPQNLGYTIINDKNNHDGTTLAAGRFSHSEEGYTDDIIIGDPWTHGEPFQGRVIIIFGQKEPFKGNTLFIQNLTLSTGLIINGQEESGGSFGVSIELIQTQATGKKNLFIGSPIYQNLGKKQAGRVYEISHFPNNKIVYQIEELAGLYGRIIDGNEGDQLGGRDPGSPSIIGVKNSAGLEDVFIGAPAKRKAYLLFTE